MRVNFREKLILKEMELMGSSGTKNSKVSEEKTKKNKLIEKLAIAIILAFIPTSKKIGEIKTTLSTLKNEGYTESQAFEILKNSTVKDAKKLANGDLKTEEKYKGFIGKVANNLIDELIKP